MIAVLKLAKYSALALSVIAFAHCADSLDVANENEPPVEVLSTEAGLERLALGVWFFDDGQRIGDFTWLTQVGHSIMGDETYVPWGNFGWRWQNTTAAITYTSATGLVTATPPNSGPQGETLISFNDRANVDNNAFAFEWRAMYRANNTANLILANVATAEFSGDPATTAAAYNAWARFWKGWAYSRIGSMYADGLIIDEVGVTNDNYVPNSAIIDEANSQFEQALSALDATDAAAWDILIAAALPDNMAVENGSPSISDMRAMINTMKARNLLVNRRAFDIATETLPEITDADYQQILDLTANGVQQDGNWIQFRAADANGVFFPTIWPPWRVLNGWQFMSERLVQDFKEGDSRRDRNVARLESPTFNQRNRGIQFGTRWTFIAIENGGDYATTTEGLASIPMAGSWSENALMRAEALIRTGSIDDGLALIDAVRADQNAGLDAVADDGLDEAAAYQELRLERRIGLIFQGLQFYDARRWGVTVPIAQGGGREDAVVVINVDGDVDEEAIIDYDYLDYFGVPDDELDFNETDRAAVAPISPR